MLVSSETARQIRRETAGLGNNSSITGKEYPLSKIFSNDFEAHIPEYQRPYALTENETGELFKDLYVFFWLEETENDFLGSIVLS